jgi:glycosyltransferase involved in cell wall biosynthesis
VDIAVNTRLVIKEKMDGIGWFTYETMLRIAASHPQHHFWFLFDRPIAKTFMLPRNVTPVVVRPVTRLPLLLEYWNYYAVPKVLKRLKPDIYLSSDGFLPKIPDVPSLVVIHDLNFEHYPEFLPEKYRRIYQKRLRESARFAHRICTVSEASKADIASTYQINPEKIDVVYCGLNSFIKPITQEEIDQVQRQFRISNDYFIVVGTLHPRKNIHGTIKAFGTYRSRTNRKMQLVFAGNNKWFTREMKEALDTCEYRDDIVFTGRVTDHEMNGLVTGSKAMIYVSFFEGFGMPILEAAAARIPIVTSNNTSMKEIAGDAALLVDPSDVHAIANALEKIVSDDQLSQILVKRASSLPEQFSWEKSAAKIWQSITRVYEMATHDGMTPHEES